jgi:hypothetical protein
LYYDNGQTEKTLKKRNEPIGSLLIVVFALYLQQASLLLTAQHFVLSEHAVSFFWSLANFWLTPA